MDTPLHGVSLIDEGGPRARPGRLIGYQEVAAMTEIDMTTVEGADLLTAQVAMGLGGGAYADAISRVALIGSFNTSQSAFKFASRGLT